MYCSDLFIVLIAPNVGEQMGGEAIKALQIFRELSKDQPNTVQITHERNRSELSDRLRLSNVFYVPDSPVSLFLWHSRVLRWLLDPWFCRKAIRLAEQLVEARRTSSVKVVFHQTEPNSPVMPRFISRKYPNVFGPVNGNIYYPKIFRRHETLSAKLRRLFHMPFQFINRLIFRGVTKADLVLCAGGPRTRRSLLAGGCEEGILVDCLDCGVSDEILDRDRVRQQGTNFRFVHFGRLVFHKGTTLIIESLSKTKQPICIDIIGKGPELERCRLLVDSLGLRDRVNFMDWFPSHRQLLDSFGQYRGALLPSIEDANGIVVQEAMALGLPCICLDWGGPQLLVEDGVSGFLVKPLSREAIIQGLAENLDRLAMDGELAEGMSLAARKRAESWRWSAVASEWLSLYHAYLSERWRRSVARSENCEAG
ncbi:glycosyltransferase [Bradyrhizobium ganzhouense]|uniref:glycosyltransferase n=1 Tax=Bradyrhizobium ganzhouense TaxID=1179767 RepID=UPI003CF4F06C